MGPRLLPRIGQGLRLSATPDVFVVRAPVTWGEVAERFAVLPLVPFRILAILVRWT